MAVDMGVDQLTKPLMSSPQAHPAESGSCFRFYCYGSCYGSWYGSSIGSIRSKSSLSKDKLLKKNAWFRFDKHRAMGSFLHHRRRHSTRCADPARAIPSFAVVRFSITGVCWSCRLETHGSSRRNLRYRPYFKPTSYNLARMIGAVVVVSCSLFANLN